MRLGVHRRRSAKKAIVASCERVPPGRRPLCVGDATQTHLHSHGLQTLLNVSLDARQVLHMPGFVDLVTHDAGKLDAALVMLLSLRRGGGGGEGKRGERERAVSRMNQTERMAPLGHSVHGRPTQSRPPFGSCPGTHRGRQGWSAPPARSSRCPFPSPVQGASCGGRCCCRRRQTPEGGAGKRKRKRKRKAEAESKNGESQPERTCGA